MNREDIRDAIQRNLENAGVMEADIRVQPDPFSGWQIAVISKSFEGKNRAERRRIALDDLETVNIEWDELLTPEEREWAAELPGDAAPEDAPLWPEALARGQRDPEGVLFPSALDDDLQLPIKVSFYSLRGGVGRSTALAYTGRILSSKGRKVVCVDMDLEAPGLAALFGCEGQVAENQGVAELLVQIDQGETPDLASHLLKVTDDDLYCLPAGLPTADYARLLRFIDPAAWYGEERNPLRELLKLLEEGLPFKPDIILFDSRTGITPLSGPLLFDLSDLSVVVFFPHPQAKSGTRALVRALLGSKTRREINGRRLTPEPRFIVSPIPASQAREVIDRYRHRALEWVEEWLQPISPSGVSSDINEIAHFIAYKELLATSDGVLEDKRVWQEYDPIAQWVERFLPTSSEKDIASSLESLKPRILNELRFSAGTAERQADFMETFVETDTVRNAIDADIPLVIGRKGTGKTAIFRRMMEDDASVAIHAPSPLDEGKTWMLSQEGFAAVAKCIDKEKANWRQFWATYICLALQASRPSSTPPPADPPTEGFTPVTTEGDVVRIFEKNLQTDPSGLQLNEWLSKADAHMSGRTILLFDGLDVGFGSSASDRERRNDAISGLFDYWMSRESKFSRIAFKIFLREDLWRSIQFGNKSHLYGRAVTLKWDEPLAYYKVAIKQALRSDSFLEALSGQQDRVGRAFPDRFETWPDADVQAAWNLLVGERMKGGKTAFTRNWVWSRLADGKNDHSPRYLLQLFHRIVAWEKSEHGKSPYERSVIRPRAMENCLPKVSEEALNALLEEFGELKEFIEHIRNNIDRTPIPASSFAECDPRDVNLAVEAGLLSVYEGTTENVERYKVPDLFRHALNLARKGQF